MTENIIGKLQKLIGLHYLHLQVQYIVVYLLSRIPGYSMHNIIHAFIILIIKYTSIEVMLLYYTLSYCTDHACNHH